MSVEGHGEWFFFSCTSLWINSASNEYRNKSAKNVQKSTNIRWLFKSVDQFKIKINDNLCSTNIDENSRYTPVHIDLNIWWNNKE